MCGNSLDGNREIPRSASQRTADWSASRTCQHNGIIGPLGLGQPIVGGIAKAGRSVHFSTLADIIASLAKAERDGQLRERIRYRVLAERGNVELAFCWAHVRRRFYELAVAGPAPIASEALERIAKLYAVESEVRGRGADEHRAVRQEKSKPIVDDLESWLRAKLELISQKTKLAEAIRYALSRWQGLVRFIDDGRIEVDSNVVERSIRPIALNSKKCALCRL